MDKESDSRRPIASRQSGWAQATAAFLANKNISPNFISVLSIAFAAVSLLAFYVYQKEAGGTRGEPEVQQPLKPGVAYVLSQRLVYGKPAHITNPDVSEILKQIENDLNALKEKL